MGILEKRVYGVRVAPLVAWLFVVIVGAYNFSQGEERDNNNRKTAAAIQQNADEARSAIVISGRTATTLGCNRDFRSISRLRALINDQRPRIAQFVAEGTLTEAQGQRALKDIDHNLSLSPLPDCRKAQSAITDDPGKTGKIPAPLYPGHNKPQLTR